MDITAYELAQAIQTALAFGDAVEAMRLTAELVAHYEDNITAEQAHYAQA